MALVTRISRLFKADFHAVLDHFEEPDVQLRQAIREMQEAQAEDERQHKLLLHEQQQFNHKNEALQQQLNETETELDICFEADKPDLARVLIRRKLEASRHSEVVVAKLARIKQSLHALDRQLQEQRSQLDSLRQKAELLAEESLVEQQHFDIYPDFSVCDEDVEVAFLREQKRRVAK